MSSLGCEQPVAQQTRLLPLYNADAAPRTGAPGHDTCLHFFQRKTGVTASTAEDRPRQISRFRELAKVEPQSRQPCPQCARHRPDRHRVRPLWVLVVGAEQRERRWSWVLNNESGAPPVFSQHLFDSREAAQVDVWDQEIAAVVDAGDCHD
jgi:hypothetical protein